MIKILVTKKMSQVSRNEKSIRLEEIKVGKISPL